MMNSLVCIKCGMATRSNKAKYCDACRSVLYSEKMAITNKTYASKRMINKNPMFIDEYRLKMTETLKKIKHKPLIRGGNGTNTPIPVMFVYKMLSSYNPFLEYCITTRNNPLQIKVPVNYKIDIAIPSQFIAIEVDGSSHQSLKRKEADARKTAYLESVGWKVFRIKNKEVELYDYEVIYDAIT